MSLVDTKAETGADSLRGSAIPFRTKMRSASSSVASFDTFLEKEKNKTLSISGTADGQPKLKLFESSLAHERRSSTPNDSPKQPTFNISGPTELAIQDATYARQASMPNMYDQRTKDSQDPYTERLDDAHMRETPEFKRYEEATNIELFYDLFFVANLTTFTDAHDINDIPALKAYAGFFCILWFLWVQVSLFDVRFVQDSILERVGKACQFGVMVGLAIVGPDFNPQQQEQSVFRSLAIILMISRVVLGFQYMIVLYEVWYYKNTKLPLVLIVTANFIAALVYLGTFFGFKPNTPQSGVFVIWYVTAVLETTFNIAVSSRWEVLTFVGTHLIKRMSLLTLIILGEGIIALSQSIATITSKEESLTSPLLGTIISAVIIIYFIYMLYFDWMSRSHFGSFLEGLWAFLHFPFHLSLVLLMEGAAQFILWRKVVEVVGAINKQFLTAEETFTGTSSLALSQLFSNVTNDVFTMLNPKFTHTIDEAQTAIYAIGNSTFNSTDQLRQISTLFAVIQDSIFADFGIEPPEVEMSGSLDPNDEWNRNMGAFMLVFIYFFISSGITLLLMNALNFLSRPKKSQGDYIRIGINFIVGVALCSVAGIVQTEQGFVFAQSPWILPTVAGAFIVVMALAYTKLLR